MALNSSGPISLGGATQGESVNLELGAGASSLISFNDADVRTLTGTTANTALTMPTEFYGKALGISVQYLLVGGGGGGQSSVFTTVGAGGGGGGGVASGLVTLPTSGPITVTVGTGGSADAAGANTSISGSTISTVTAVGGGYGGGGNGGSGGGAGGGVTASGGTGTVGQGNAGGASTATGSGGGGGGASAAGADGSATGGGSGGAGTLSTISGAATYYGGGGGAGGGTLFYTISKSLRLRKTSGAYLSRIPTTAGNRTTWTWSGWVKRGSLSSVQIIGHAGTNGGTDTGFYFTSADKIDFYNSTSGTINGYVTTAAVFRDPSSWYHMIFVFDTTNATAANRMQIYVNGVLQTVTVNTQISQNTSGAINNTVVQRIGATDLGQSLDGYLAEINFIDGQALTPTSFGTTNPTTGVWGPSQYTGSYGTNGYYLPFTDTASVYALGYDLKTGTSHIGSSGTYTVPSYSSSLVVELWGGGGGGGGGGATYGNSGGTGGATTFAAPSGTLSAGGGTGGTGVYRTDQGSPSGTGVSGSGGTASGGDTNTNGNSIATSNASSTGAGAPNGGGNTATAQNNADSFNGTYPGGAASGGVYLGPSQPTGGAGGSGAYVKKTYSAGQLTVGSSITAVVGTGGASGSADAQPGGIGAGGVIRIGIDGVTVNDWAPTNVSLTSGANYDSMTDVPTLTSATASNYAVLNPLQSYYVPTNGNMSVSTSANSTGFSFSSILLGTGVKFYFEATATGTYEQIGIFSSNHALTQTGSKRYWYVESGGLYNDNTLLQSVATFTSGDTIAVAWDGVAQTVTFYKNNTQQGAAISVDTSYSYFFGVGVYNGGWNVNFGQRPWTYTPPTGYVALNSYNLPTPTIPAGNGYMDATLYTGNGSTQTITNAAGFKPDLVWSKSRSNGYSHKLFDSVRGVYKQLNSNNTDAESTNANMLTAFNSNGFSIGNDTGINGSGATFVGWQWQAGQGTTSTNTSGTITSTVSVNTTAGFSVVTYTGTGANATVGHGLGFAPSMAIFKSRTGTGWLWAVYHVSTGNTGYLRLDGTDSFISSGITFQNTSPSSSVFTLGTAGHVNSSGNNLVAYCWTPIAGYSQFGSYTGNGSSDGPFIYLGFRPRYILVKSSTLAQNWTIYDTARSPYNATDLLLYPMYSNAENQDTGQAIDLVSNGFKIKNSNANENTSGQTYIYAAFAENPFKYSLAR